jgi:hypothetical protein
MQERCRGDHSVAGAVWRFAGMSYQVRQYEPSSSRFRSAGFNSASPPSGSATADAETEKQPCSWMSYKHPGPKKRNVCPIAAAFLDPALWRFLPDDLLEKVAACMPFPGLFRCRAVNKRLKEFVFSEKFQEARECVKAWDALSPKCQYLLLFATIKGENLCTAYDASSNRWLRMPPMRGLHPRAKDCIAGELLHVQFPFLWIICNGFST